MTAIFLIALHEIEIKRACFRSWRADANEGERNFAEAIEAARKAFGLDKPIYVQYADRKSVV